MKYVSFFISLKTPVLWRRDLLTSDISPSGKNPTTKLFFKHLACPSESNFGYNESTSSLRRMPPWPKVVAPTLVTLLSMLASSIGLNLDGKSEKNRKELNLTKKSHFQSSLQLPLMPFLNQSYSYQVNNAVPQ